jgi:hypothetical protein
MAKVKDAEKEEAVKHLRKLLKPGDTVYTVLRHVSGSGMSRRIDLFTIRKNQLCFLSGWVGKALGYKRHPKHDGLTVGGCGMDMGFHLVHELGYCLWGKLAGEGTSRAAIRLRRRMAKSCASYLGQGGGAIPNPDEPAGVWQGASGYALKHQWI